MASLRPLRKFIAVRIGGLSGRGLSECPIIFLGTPTPGHNSECDEDAVGRLELQVRLVIVRQRPKTGPAGKRWTAFK